MSTSPVVPVPTRRVTRVPFRKRIVAGIGLAVVALVMVVVGALVQTGSLGAQVLRPAARGDIGEAVSFEAKAARYDLIAIRSDAELAGVVEDTAGRTRCEITLADGSTATVRGDRQALSTDTSFGATIGWFDAIAGPTTVVCDHNVTQGVVLGGYTVAESYRRLAAVAIGLIVAGIVAALVATALIASGARGKAVMIDV